MITPGTVHPALENSFPQGQQGPRGQAQESHKSVEQAERGTD